MASALHVVGRNRLLDSLPANVSDRVKQNLEKVTFTVRKLLYESNAPIEYIYFPLGGVMSLVVEMEDGGTVEVGTIGNEGMVGTPVFLGAEKSPTKAFCQVPGDCLRMPVASFKRELSAEDGILRDRVSRHAQGMINQISQSVACNHLHSIEERTARWLLMTHDRVGQNELLLTQEFLAQMLGVRRPSVTVAAGLLDKAGLITYKRGRITVVDRERLEEAACECYSVVKREYERLLLHS